MVLTNAVHTQTLPIVLVESFSVGYPFIGIFILDDLRSSTVFHKQYKQTCFYYLAICGALFNNVLV